MTRIAPGPINTTVELSITRSQGGHEPEKCFRLTIQDEKSRRQIVELRMTAEQFANALMGSIRDIQAELISHHAYRQVNRYTCQASIYLAQDFDGQGYRNCDVRLSNLIEGAAIAEEIGGDSFRVSRHNEGRLSLAIFAHTDTIADAKRTALALQSNLNEYVQRSGWNAKSVATYFAPREDDGR